MFKQTSPPHPSYWHILLMSPSSFAKKERKFGQKDKQINNDQIYLHTHERKRGWGGITKIGRGIGREATWKKRVKGRNEIERKTLR